MTGRYRQPQLGIVASGVVVSQQQVAHGGGVAEDCGGQVCDHDGDAGGDGRAQLFADTIGVGYVDLSRQRHDHRPGRALWSGHGGHLSIGRQLSTVNEDGSPHVTAVGALWVDGTFWFQTGAGTRKGRNVARDPRCSVAVSIRGADVVIEGDAVRVTEPGAVARIAKAWADNGWPAEPDESGSGITAPFNAPSLGPPPWNVYRIEPRSATVVLATDPAGLARFCF